MQPNTKGKQGHRHLQEVDSSRARPRQARFKAWVWRGGEGRAHTIWWNDVADAILLRFCADFLNVLYGVGKFGL